MREIVRNADGENTQVEANNMKEARMIVEDFNNEKQ